MIGTACFLFLAGVHSRLQITVGACRRRKRRADVAPLRGFNWAGSWALEPSASPSDLSSLLIDPRPAVCLHSHGLHPRGPCRRYGLIGPNGCGKSCLLKALGARDLPIPDHIDVYLLSHEIPGTDMTALEAVKSVDAERARLEAEAEALADQQGEEVEARLEDIYERWGSWLRRGPGPRSRFRGPVRGWAWPLALAREARPALIPLARPPPDHRPTQAGRPGV